MHSSQIPVEVVCSLHDSKLDLHARLRATVLMPHGTNLSEVWCREQRGFGFLSLNGDPPFDPDTLGTVVMLAPTRTLHALYFDPSRTEKTLLQIMCDAYADRVRTYGVS